MSSLTLTAGSIHYDRSGPADGRAVVFIHGYAMGRSLWRPVTERLSARGLACLAPTWPLGAQTEPMNEGADLSMEGVAALVAELLEALGLDDVVLVGNDTGGAIAQLVAVETPERLGALVLTSCDAFEHFPPPILKPLIAAAKVPPAFAAALQPMRTRFGRKRAYGALAHADIDHLAAEWIQPALTDARVRDDLGDRAAGVVADQHHVLERERIEQVADHRGDTLHRQLGVFAHGLWVRTERPRRGKA